MVVNARVMLAVVLLYVGFLSVVLTEPCTYEEETQNGYAVNFNRIYYGNENNAQCQTKCDNTVGCTAWVTFAGGCRVYGEPILDVYISYDLTLEACKERCSQRSACVTGYLRGVWCVLFDSEQTEFNSGPDYASYTVFHKVDMNCASS